LSKSHRAFATIFLTIFLASAIIPIAFNNQTVTTISLIDIPPAPSATNYIVSIRVLKNLQVFNDDDFEFTVLNDLIQQCVGSFIRCLYFDTIAGHLTENPEYHDFEGFTYYETSYQPFVGAVANVTYINGTVYDVKTTTNNETVVFVHLSVDFIDWSGTNLGFLIGLGDYCFNLSAPIADISSPVITSPGNQDVLLGSENVTTTWHLEDE